MRTTLTPCLALGLALAGSLLTPISAQAQITVNVYRGHSTDGGGAPYSDLVGSFDSPDIQFGNTTGYAWHPFGLDSFGADLLGCLSVEKTGDYVFSLGSDDGSLLFIDGALVIDNGGGHGPNTVTNTIPMTGGTHAFEIQFYEDFGGASGLDLTLPGGVTYAACPEPGALASLLGLGVAGIGFVRRRRR